MADLISRKEQNLKLINMIKNGDNQGYKYIYDHHYILLCNMAFGFVKDFFWAQTIVEDTIFHLWEIRESLEITSSLRSYLVQAVRNRCINSLDVESTKREISLSILVKHDECSNSFLSEDHPLATLLEKELEQEIKQAINKLPEESRRVFKMSRFENKRYEEIANDLNISINTVKYHIKNALLLLNADLKKYLLICLTLLLFS